MKRYLFLTIFLINVLSSWSNPSLQQLYQTLDSLIELQSELSRSKDLRISNIKAGLRQSGLSKADQWEICHRIFQEYQAFRFDSASVYIDRCIDLARRMKNSQHYYRALTEKADLLSVSGLLVPAIQTIAEVDTSKLSYEDKMMYYRVQDDLSLYNSEISYDTKYSDFFNAEGKQWRTLLLSRAPHSSFEYITVKAKTIGFDKDIDGAITLLSDYFKTLVSGDRSYSIIASTLAFYFGLQGDKQLEERMYLLSAISDIKGCIRENSSLHSLAALLYDRQETDKAFKYLRASVNDATFYNARIRMIQSARLMPKIIDAYEMEQHKSHSRLTIFAIVLSGIFLCLVAGFVYILLLSRRLSYSNRRVKESNRLQQQAMEQLATVNEQQQQTLQELNESNSVKEEYVSRFMQLYSKMIDSSKIYQQQINRLAKNKDMEQLSQALKSQKYVDELTTIFFKNFDEAFLNIYPNFVEGFNCLLQPEEQVHFADNGALTTEMRIYALIRLGINDNQEIADILRSSITTIYTYRSRMKKKAIDRDNFETLVMDL